MKERSYKKVSYKTEIKTLSISIILSVFVVILYYYYLIVDPWS